MFLGILCRLAAEKVNCRLVWKSDGFHGFPFPWDKRRRLRKWGSHDPTHGISAWANTAAIACARTPKESFSAKLYTLIASQKFIEPHAKPSQSPCHPCQKKNKKHTKQNKNTSHREAFGFPKKNWLQTLQNSRGGSAAGINMVDFQRLANVTCLLVTSSSLKVGGAVCFRSAGVVCLWLTPQWSTFNLFLVVGFLPWLNATKVNFLLPPGKWDTNFSETIAHKNVHKMKRWQDEKSNLAAYPCISDTCSGNLWFTSLNRM